MSNYGSWPFIYPFLHFIESDLPRYFIRVSISRRMADVAKEKDIWVHSFRMPPDSNNSIKMEVGIEDCLHIEFEYNKSKYVVFSLPSVTRLTASQDTT